MSTILIGADGREESTDAITFGAHLATATGSSLVVATACTDDDQRAAAARTAGAAAARLHPLIPRVRAVTGASPATALHDLAVAEGVDLVVVGCTHTGRFGRVVPGATGERLLHDATYAVAVVPRGYHAAGVERIGVAYDATPESAAAVATAVDLARAFDAVLEVIGVVPADPYELPAETARRVDATLEAVVRDLPYGIRARPVRLAGQPAAALAARSERLDLLVTGSRGFGPLRAVLSAAVSGRVQRNAACPVIAVPRGVQVFSGRSAPAIRVASASATITAMSA